MVTYPRAATVAPGDPLNASQLRSLAAAINERFRHGPDCAWRLVFYWLSLFRQIRNPADGFNLWPPDAEFFLAYQMLEPQSANWPVTAPGDFEGANLANHINAYAFGAAAINLDDEATRLTGDGGVPLDYPSTPEGLWELAKSQRGAYDPDSGLLGSPTFTAAREHFKISGSLRSKHGNSYGGFMPAPVFLGDCPDGTVDEPASPDYEIFFTNLNDESVITYPGSCPTVDGNVGWISRTPWAYFVYIVGGGVDVLPVKDWIEGPYKGGAWLTKQRGYQLQRALNNFTTDFRGTDAQRESGWLNKAFDTQRFLTHQYLLAPCIGHAYSGQIAADYPKFRFSGARTIPDGRFATKDGGGNTHSIAIGFILAAVFVRSTALIDPAKVELISAGKVIKTLDVPRGNDGAIVILDNPGQFVDLQFRLKGQAQFSDDAGAIEIECAELYEYKPQLCDLFVFLRLGTCKSDILNTLDGSGLNETRAKELSDAYFKTGAILNATGQAGLAERTDEVNSNAVFDAARRLSQCIRIVPRANFIGYEVVDGKSVCYFKRYAFGLGNDSPVDYFAGIADAIKHDADEQGFTNEWLMGQQFKGSNPMEESIWKSDAYTDYFFFNERCHFYHAPYPTDLKRHFDYGANISIAPEAPTGYRYIHGKNKIICGDVDCETRRRNRYKSCRLYEADPEIEDARAIEENGEQLVKVIFKTRFHHSESAPDSIDRDVTGWDRTALHAEAAEYRTVENALREYLVWASYGEQCDYSGQGNAAAGSPIYTLPDAPYGSCFPSFYFVQLLPMPRAGNGIQEVVDSPFLHDQLKQSEHYIRAMCEGFVDGQTSVEIGCETGVSALFDYSFENLCYEAFGNRWMNALPQSETKYTAAKDTRPDNLEGYGPLPNTLASAEIFNQLSSAVNLLARVRFTLPMKFEAQYYNGGATIHVPSQYGTAPDNNCTTGTVIHNAWKGTPANPGVTLTTPWYEIDSVTSQVVAAIDSNSCDGDNWNLVSGRDDYDYRYTLQDPDAIYAVPEEWRGLLTGNGRLLASISTTIQTLGIRQVSDPADAYLCGEILDPFRPGGDFYAAVDTITNTTETCGIVPATDYVSAPPIPTSAFPIQRSNTGAFPVECFPSATTSKGIAPIADQDGFFIEVPLYDFQG